MGNRAVEEVISSSISAPLAENENGKIRQKLMSLGIQRTPKGDPTEIPVAEFSVFDPKKISACSTPRAPL
jgi:Fe2+ transport system protein FeoA